MAQYIRALPAPVLVQVGANHMAGLSQLLGASQVAVHNGYGGFQKDTRAEQVLEKFGLVDMLLEQLTLPDLDYGFPPFQQLEIRTLAYGPSSGCPFGTVKARKLSRDERPGESRSERASKNARKSPRPSDRSVRPLVEGDLVALNSLNWANRPRVFPGWCRSPFVLMAQQGAEKTPTPVRLTLPVRRVGRETV